MSATIHRRTFEAAKYPQGSKERAALNHFTLTSEYMPSLRYMVQKPALMSDGTQNPAQAFHVDAYRTKSEAVAKAGGDA